MEISSQNNNVIFTSTPIHRVNVINTKDGSFLPAIFSKLDQKEPEDAKAIKKISSSWLKFETYNFPKQIVKTSKNNLALLKSFFTGEVCDYRSFYALELLQKPNASKPLAKRIIGIMCIRESVENNRLCLALLNTKPKFIVQNDNRTIKGSGENLFAEAINLAKEKKFSSVIIDSYNDRFYLGTLRNAKIVDEELRESGLFIIPQKYFNKYLDYWKKKFALNF